MRRAPLDPAAYAMAQKLMADARRLRGMGFDGPADTLQRAGSWFWLVGLRGEAAALAAVAKVQPVADYQTSQWGRA